MALRVYVLTKDGRRNEGVFYFHEQAFTKAITLESITEFPFIEEHQWHPDKNALIEKVYYVRNKAVYVKEDAINPIYSFLPVHSSISFYRKIVYAMCKKAKKMYKYYEIPCSYNDEYLYSLTLTELKGIEYILKQDAIVIKFNKDIELLTKGIIDTTKTLNINIPDFYHMIMKLDANEMMVYLRGIEKNLKNYLLKNVYGASFIDNF